MSAKILVVEDEEDICTLIAYNLRASGFQVETVSDGGEALEAVEIHQPNLVILDWMLPNLSGIEICRQLRAKEGLSALPIIMTTARGEEEDRIRGLDMGADDYLTKPFSISELTARVRAVLRRTTPNLSNTMVRFGDITLDRETMRVHRGDAEVKLGPTEFRLLDCFMQRPGRVLNRERLLDLVWGREVYVELRTVDVHVGRLRKALKKDGAVDPIRTVRAAGYALDDAYAVHSEN